MIKELSKADYTRLVEVWESAVKSTHDFLKKEDLLYYKEQLPTYFQYVRLFGFEKSDLIIAFIGVTEDNLEMLFVHDKYRGKGIGKILAQYAMDYLSVTKVDVNEQNTLALGFYKSLGFEFVSRSEVDGEGKPYPILHLAK